MTSTFAGFSEEDLKRIKSAECGTNSDGEFDEQKVTKVLKLEVKPRKIINQYKLPIFLKQDSDDAIDNIEFGKCKLSIKTPTTPADDVVNNNNLRNETGETAMPSNDEEVLSECDSVVENNNSESRRSSIHISSDIVRGMDNYTEDELAVHRVKLEELQLQQRLMEEQNKKRKEMLAKALADRTRQTEEEVMRLEKIKKELQVLDGQFSLDVAVLRKKIDQACLSYSEAEKHYLKVEKEFLQAKINLQKEREKKELLTEHLCALITHNETRKAQKLETLMLELATERKNSVDRIESPVHDKSPVVVDGVDQRTGKMVEIFNDS